ncbi:MAG: hypothetical protein KAS96_12235 [Planctomycetes bacterium]|nr:hypothetical protein [Planctomycetota bacterium]
MGANTHYAAKNKGFALLFLLLGVIVMIVGYYLVINPKPSSDSLQAQEQEPEKYPWVEKNRIKQETEDIRKPEPEQPQIEKTTIYEALLKKDNDERGFVLIKVDPTGLVEVRWAGSYMTAKPRMEFQVISSSATGNIDPSKIYEDEVDIDYEKLYIITKGRFSILETNYENGKIRKTSGLLYLTGWLDKKQQIKGYVSITSDKNNVKVFDYIAEKTNIISLPKNVSFKDIIKMGLGN